MPVDTLTPLVIGDTQTHTRRPDTLKDLMKVQVSLCEAHRANSKYPEMTVQYLFCFVVFNRSAAGMESASLQQRLTAATWTPYGDIIDTS